MKFHQVRSADTVFLFFAGNRRNADIRGNFKSHSKNGKDAIRKEL